MKSSIFFKGDVLLLSGSTGASYPNVKRQSVFPHFISVFSMLLQNNPAFMSQGFSILNAANDYHSHIDDHPLLSRDGIISWKSDTQMLPWARFFIVFARSV
jgi:hypothetical protein